jgi:hypothetical protein
MLFAQVARADTEFRVSPSAGAGQIGEDFFSELRLDLGVQHEWFDLDLVAPLALRLIDNAPGDREKDIGGVIRGRDWDEIADIGRVIGAIRLGRPTDTVRAYFGPLTDITLGHGSIIERYSNQIDRDRQRAGGLVRVELPWLDGELGWSNVFGADLGWARVEILPTSRNLEGGEGPSVGASFVADFSAPRCLWPCAATAPMATVGVDAEWAWYFGERFRLAPYADFNGQFSRGVGLSAGTRATLYIPFGAHPNIQLSLIGEYTLSSDGYTPRYFTALYDSERFATQTGSAATPKALETVRGGSGGRLGLELDVPHLARFAMFGELRPSPYDGDFFFDFNLPITRWVRAGALLFQREIRSGADFFSSRTLWLLSAEVAVRFAEDWNVYAQLGHTYRLAREGVGLEAGLDWMVGVRYTWSSLRIAPGAAGE